MTAPGFERLLYTDCRAGDGRGGGGGFQIQAQSVGVDQAQARMAVSWLLYATQDAWMARRVPVEDFPLGLAHAAESGYGTGQSRYLGREVNGARDGNHLADCLLTRNPESYGVLRPAQLWRAELWRDGAWNSTECPPFDDFLEPGPLDNDTLADWLRQLPSRADVLKRLVSKLESIDGAKVVIVAHEPDEALRWIATATLLLPMHRALDVSFKVFAKSLDQTPHRILAVPHSLYPQLTVGGRNPRFVLDATTETSDPCPISSRAAYWVERLVASDPFDVVDAVELAETLGGDDEQSLSDARETAWALTSTADPVADPSALARWLSAANPRELDRHGSAVAAKILDSEPGAEALRWIDQAAALGRVRVDRAATRSALLVAEVGRARGGMSPPQKLLDRVDLDPDVQRDAESLVASFILLDADDPTVELLLRVAWRHGVALPLAALRDRLYTFVVAWTATPEADYEPAMWALREEILDLLHAELTHEAARAGAAAVLPALHRFWPLLIDRSGDLSEPLNWQLHAAALRTTPPESRYQRIKESFAGAAGHLDRAAILAGLQQAMLDWGVIGEPEAMAIARLLPVDVRLDARIAQLALNGTLARAHQPDTHVLGVVVMLDRRGMLPRTAVLDELAMADRLLLDLATAIRDVRTATEVSSLDPYLTELANVHPGVVQVWLPQLVQLAMASPVSQLGSRLLKFLSGPLGGSFIMYWARELDGASGVRAAQLGVAWYADRDTPLDTELRAMIARDILAYGDRLGVTSREQWIDAVGARLSQAQSQALAELTASNEIPQRRRRWSRGK